MEGCYLPRPYEWRLMSECSVGSVHGIPSINGIAVATNGILVCVQQGTTFKIAHAESWVADEVECEVKRTAQKTAISKNFPPVNPFEGFI